MKTALITGVTGQDGSYLAELLFEKGYRVIGVVQDAKTAEEKMPATLIRHLVRVEWDMRNMKTIADMLFHYRPDEIYNLAAYSSGSGMFQNAVDMGDINGLAMARLLTAARESSEAVRFCQASSREIFDATARSPQSEATPLAPRSPYGAAKCYAHHMVQIYRRHYGMFACSAILFNHESPRRGLAFVTRKITDGVAKIKGGLSRKIQLGDLEARRDWGYAPEYVEALWRMLQQPHPDDYVIATGQTHTVREIVALAFQAADIEIFFEGEGVSEKGIHKKTGDMVVEVSADLFRPADGKAQAGDFSKAQQKLGWAPKTTLKEWVRIMVDADCERIQATQ